MGRGLGLVGWRREGGSLGEETLGSWVIQRKRVLGGSGWDLWGAGVSFVGGRQHCRLRGD